MIRLGIIGVGGYGKTHLARFLELQAAGRVRIVAMADCHEASLAEARQHPGAEAIRPFTDYREMLACGLDAVAIAAPIPFHEEMTLLALEHGLHVLLEKPPVALLSQLETLMKVDVEGRLMVAFHHPYLEHLQQLREDLLSERSGRLIAISSWGLWPRNTAYYERAGWAGKQFWRGYPVMDGPATNAMAHYLNALFFVSGERLRPEGGFDAFEAEMYRARPTLESYDTACLRGRLGNGADFFYGVTHATRTIRGVEMRIETEEKTIRLSNDLLTISPREGEVTRYPDRRREMFRRFIAFAEGDRAANLTPLESCLPYVAATHAMRIVSGGIHDIAPEWIDSPEENDPQGIYGIRGISDDLRRAFEARCLLAEAGAQWALERRRISSAVAAAPAISAPLRVRRTVG